MQLLSAGKLNIQKDFFKLISLNDFKYLYSQVE